MTNEKADEIIALLTKIVDRLCKPAGESSPAAPPLADRPRARRFPLREDPGTVFRSRPGYNWTCPYCNKAILEGDMVVAFQPKPGTRTTYAHLECDTQEEKHWHEMDQRG